MTEIPDAVVTRALDRVASGRDLTAEDAAAVLGRIMSGEVSQTQIAGFLIGLRTKGETAAEIIGFARTMRSLATPVETRRPRRPARHRRDRGRAELVQRLDDCRPDRRRRRLPGRQARQPLGDQPVRVGRPARGARRPDRPPAAGRRPLHRRGRLRLHVRPAHHQATRFVVPVRKQLGVRTIFNFLGPLTNPAGAGRQLIGVADPTFTEVIAAALDGLGATRALIVTSEDGLDELSATAPTHVIEVGGGGETRRYTVTPRELGIDPVDGDGVPGGTPAENAQTTRLILAGRTGPAREMALINSGAAIYAAGLAETIAHGVELARAAIDDGSAAAVLDRFVALTNELAAASRDRHPPATGMSTVLDRILATTREDVDRRRGDRPLRRAGAGGRRTSFATRSSYPACRSSPSTSAAPPRPARSATAWGWRRSQSPTSGAGPPRSPC